MPMVQQVQVMPAKKKDIAGLVKTIAIIIISLIAVTFIGLFIWMFTRYNDASSDLEYKIDTAVAEAKDEQHAKDEAEYIIREKNPYKTFAGPEDYGQLTFQYPKTWSVYVESDASSGGDFKAYFNPIQVNAVGKDTINALRVTVRNASFDSVVNEYKRYVEGKDPTLTVESINIGDTDKGFEVPANFYSGNIPGTDLNGFIVTFKIRDKTVILQTDSVLFENDFRALLGTIVFNA